MTTDMLAERDLRALEERLAQLEADRAERTRALLQVEQEVVQLRAELQRKDRALHYQGQRIEALKEQTERRITQLTEGKDDARVGDVAGVPPQGNSAQRLPGDDAGGQ